jgi:hypothetical protein
MKALIQGNIIPQSVDCSIAFHGFEELEYEIKVFNDWIRFSGTDFREYDICVGGVDLTHFAFMKMGLKDWHLSCYPEPLRHFLYRHVEEMYIKDIIKTQPKNSFIKPVKPKRFNHIITGDEVRISEDFISFLNLDEYERAYVCEKVHFISEWRVYVRHNEIQAICFYKGMPTMFPSTSLISFMIDYWVISPCCYAMDVGVLGNGDTVLVEVNDFYSIGNYGLNHHDYAKMLQLRWNEITGAKNG